MAVATLLVAASASAQPVLSDVPDTATKQIDPDCLPADQAVDSPEERDGVCPPGEGTGQSTPPPTPGPAPQPTPPKPETTPAATAAPAKGTAMVQKRTPRTAPAQSAHEERRGEARRTRSPASPRNGHARKHAHHGRGHSRSERSHGEGRHTARRHARRSAKSRGSHQRTLKPIPGWARSLLSAPLPDPLPAGKRLDPEFAHGLERAAAQSHVSWPLVLAILRARGHESSTPAGPAEVRALARRLAKLGAGGNPLRAIKALGGTNDPAGAPAPGIGMRAGFTERVLALAGYNRAVGLSGLVHGLDAVKPDLIERVLASDRLSIYPGGRSDVKAGRIDQRVLVLMLYLAHRQGTVAVSSLMSGHGFFTKSGNVSNHSYGRAVDIAAVGGVPIVGHQEPGGVTEQTLRAILLLPKELWPSELISLFSLGGPSFAMADHADHIHAGFGR